MKPGTYRVGNHKITITKDTKKEDVKHLFKFKSFVKAAGINVESDEKSDTKAKSKPKSKGKSK